MAGTTGAPAADSPGRGLSRATSVDRWGNAWGNTSHRERPNRRAGIGAAFSKIKPRPAEPPRDALGQLWIR